MLDSMNSTSGKFATTVCALLAASAAYAVTPPQKAAEYAVIKVRNPFGLVDPAPVVVKPAEPEKKVEAEPPPNVELTGIFRSSRRGKTVAMFLVEKKKGSPKESYSWGEGDGDDGMKVLAINEADKTVKLSVRNVESTITFSERKVAAAPAAGVPPGAPGAAGAANRNRAAQPATPQGPRQIESVRRGDFGRSVSMRSAVGGGNRVQNATPQTGQYNNMSPRTLRLPSQGQPGQQQQEVLTPQEQEVLIEVNREVLKQTGQINLMPPLPPTSLTTPEDRAVIIAPPTPR